MRVLSVGSMYPPHHLGGYELMWRSGVHHLRRAGHQVRVLTTDYRTAGPDAAIGEDDDVHRELRWYWHEHEIPRRGLRERRRIERHNLETLDRHLEELRPDAVNWWAMGAMSLSLIEHGRRLELPAVGVVIDNWMVYGPHADGWQRAFGRPGALARLVERAAGIPTVLNLGDAALWLFVSEHVRERAREAGVELTESAVAHGGFADSLFPAAPQRPWGWRLLYVGRVEHRKGVQTAVRALAQLPEATLRIIGSGDDEHVARLRVIAAELGVADRVELAQAPRDRLAAAYAEADAVLFPVIWHEPWGLVPLEAMSVGTPVVATGTGGSGEYLRDGENCLLFEPHDSPEALAAAVQSLAGDETLRARLRGGGFDTAARYTEDRFNSAIADALQSVTS